MKNLKNAVPSLRTMPNRRGDLNLIIYMILVVLFIVLSIGMPFWGIDISKVDYTSIVDFAVVNGMLTATALVFSVITFQIKEFEIHYAQKMFLVAIPMIYFIVGLKKYFDDVLTVNAPTVQTLSWMTSVLFFMLLYPISLIAFKELQD